MSLVLNVEILGEFKKLTSATQGAQSDLSNMSKKASSISKGINRAFAAIGIGLSFKVIANELEEATKAAIEDRKSMELLALAMTNTGKATDATVKSAEAAISKMQIQAGIADDQLRPAYQKLFIATGDVTKSNKLLQIALDASAATGKDLDTVTQAMAKSLAGNDAALAKLIPSLKGAKNPIDEMGKAFEGASTAAANLDPYQRMQIIFGEIQEKLGTALLPVLDDLAEWLSSPPGQQTLQEIADAASNVLTELKNTAQWAIANKDWLLPLVVGVGAFSGTVKAIGTITAAINGVTTAINLANAAAGTGVLAGLGAIGAAAGSAAAILVTPGSGIQDYYANDGKRQPLQVPNSPVVSPKVKSTTSLGSSLANQNVTINVNNPNATASDIIKKLDDYYKATGTRLN